MKFIEYSQMLSTIKQMAEYQNTGSPNDLASKFNVSRRTIFRRVQHLRDRGFNITFNRLQKSYTLTDANGRHTELFNLNSFT